MLTDFLDLLFGRRIDEMKTTRGRETVSITLKERNGRRYLAVSSNGPGTFQIYTFDKASFRSWPEELRHLRGLLAPWEPRLT